MKRNFTTGMNFEEVTVFRGKEKYCKGVIREIVPNKLIKMEIVEVVSGPKLLSIRSWEFTGENGATEIVWTTIMRTKGMMRIFEFLLPKQFEKTVKEFCKI